VPYPDPRLRTVAAPVAAITDEIRTIWDEMLAAMYAMPGVGLAAPQLGIGLRLGLRVQILGLRAELLYQLLEQQRQLSWVHPLRCLAHLQTPQLRQQHLHLSAFPQYRRQRR